MGAGRCLSTCWMQLLTRAEAGNAASSAPSPDELLPSQSLIASLLSVARLHQVRMALSALVQPSLICTHFIHTL